MSEQTLKGKTALVTGGGAGIGRASAVALAKEGADVAVLDIDGDAAEATASLVEQCGAKAAAVKTDVSDGAAVDEAVRHVRAALGHPLVVYSNAGIGNTPLLFENDTFEHWRRQFAVHVDGTFHTVHQCLPAMVEAGWGRIVCTSSVAATMGIKGVVAYSAAKGALLGFVRSLALEYAAKGITVNAVAPGFIDTAMLEELGSGAVEQLEQMVPMKRGCTVEDLMKAVFYLVAQKYETGQALPVTGGQVMLK